MLSVVAEHAAVCCSVELPVVKERQVQGGYSFSYHSKRGVVVVVVVVVVDVAAVVASENLASAVDVVPADVAFVVIAAFVELAAFVAFGLIEADELVAFAATVAHSATAPGFGCRWDSESVGQ